MIKVQQKYTLLKHHKRTHFLLSLFKTQVEQTTEAKKQEGESEISIDKDATTLLKDNGVLKDIPVSGDVTKNVDSVDASDPTLEPLIETTKIKTPLDIPSPDSEDIHSKGKLL